MYFINHIFSEICGYDGIEQYIKFKEDWYEKSPIELGISSFYVVVDKSKETPTLRDMLDPEYESARQSLYPSESPD